MFPSYQIKSQGMVNILILKSAAIMADEKKPVGHKTIKILIDKCRNKPNFVRYLLKNADCYILTFLNKQGIHDNFC